ncbi:unnamed protein product, partial [Staurois parvus]
MYQCCLSVPISDACQCPSVPPISATYSVPSQCRLSVCIISATYQCASVAPISASQCHLTVPPHQCPPISYEY